MSSGSMFRTVVAAGALSWSMTAGASLIDVTSWTSAGCNGSAGCVIDNATLNAGPTGRTFSEKTVNGVIGLGISGGRTNGEIDMDETFSVSYVLNEIIDLIRIVFIYNGPEFNDVAEVAKVTVNGGDSYTLTVNAAIDNQASWSSGAVVTSCGSTTADGSGCFDIANPFGGLSVSSLSLTALYGDPSQLGGASTNQSDFSVAVISGTTAVPEPGTLTLLGAGLLSLGLMRRRRASQR
jgi:hypothetical protein